MGLLEEKLKFEKLLIRYKIFPLTIVYHGSFLNNQKRDNDIDVILIVSKIDQKLFKSLNRIVRSIKYHLGITLISVREAGTIFGGPKYYDALHRDLGYEKVLPHAYFQIASRTQLFRKEAINLNFKKCINLAKIVTKSINNYYGIKLGLNIGSFEKLVTSFEKNLNHFYDKQNIKIGRYTEEVPLRY